MPRVAHGCNWDNAGLRVLLSLSCQGAMGNFCKMPPNLSVQTLKASIRLGYFTMPLHPLHRDTTETLHEDRETLIYADRLGFYDALSLIHI